MPWDEIDNEETAQAETGGSRLRVHGQRYPLDQVFQNEWDSRLELWLSGKAHAQYAQGPGTDAQHCIHEQQTKHTSTQRAKTKPAISDIKSYILRAMWDQRTDTEAH